MVNSDISFFINLFQAVNVKIKFIYFFIILLVFSTSCKKNDSIPLMRVGYAKHDHHSALFVAVSNPEYFKKNGGIYLKEIEPKKKYLLMNIDKAAAEVLIEESPGGKELIQNLAEDKYDIALGGVPSIIHFIDRGYDIKMINPLMTDGAGFVMNKKFNIKTWNDFLSYIKKAGRPVKIGYKMDLSVQNLLTEEIFRENAITFSKDYADNSKMVKLINLHGEKNMIPSLMNSSVDGFVAMEPYLSQSEYLGIGNIVAYMNEIPSSKKMNGVPCCALAGNCKYTTKNMEASSVFVSLIMKSTRYIQENPDKSAEYVSLWLGMPLEVEKRSIPGIKFLIDLSTEWNRGISYWLASMINNEEIKGEIKKAAEEGRLNETLYNKRLYDKSMLKSKE